jgi:hypothetical protein
MFGSRGSTDNRALPRNQNLCHRIDASGGACSAEQQRYTRFPHPKIYRDLSRRDDSKNAPQLWVLKRSSF